MEDPHDETHLDASATRLCNCDAEEPHEECDRYDSDFEIAGWTLSETLGALGVRTSGYAMRAAPGDGSGWPEFHIKTQDRRSGRRLVELLTDRGDWPPGLRLDISDEGLVVLCAPLWSLSPVTGLFGRNSQRG